MAVERKAYWLRHLILIIIIIIVLFPVAWLVNTSIRRDEAAFSPNLFSTRITFQHYKNLLFPQSSIGRLVIDIQSAVYQTGDYSEKSEEEIKRIVSDYIETYDTLTEKSFENSEYIDNQLKILREEIDKSIYPNMINNLNVIRNDDMKLLKEKMDELEINTSSPYFEVAAGQIILSKDNWISEDYKYLLSLFGEKGQEINNEINAFESSLNSLKEYESELLNIVSSLDFDEKTEVLDSLSNTSFYYDPFDYTEWRKIEWLKVINKFLKNIENEELQETKTAFYDSFKSAKDIYNKVNESIEQLSSYVSDLTDNLYDGKTNDYLNSKLKLSDLENELASSYKKLNSDREVKTEILDGINLADSVVAPEAEKLEALKNTTGKTLISNAGILDSQSDSDEIFTLIIDQNKLIKEILESVKKYESVKEISVFSELENINTLYDWFIENAEVISSISQNSDIKNSLKILDVSYSNLSRILPSFKNTVDDLISSEEEIETSLSQIENLLTEKDSLESLIVENEEYALNEIGELSKAEEAVNILFAQNIAKNDFSNSEIIEKYIKSVSPLIEIYTEEKSKNRYNDYYWYSNAEEAYKNGIEGSIILRETINNMNIFMDSLKEKVYDYVKLKFLKSPVTIEEFSDLQNEFNKGYQLFSAKYQRASRLISDMLDFPPSYPVEISTTLKSMDKTLFDVIQIWKTKQRTYFFFTRWLLNSVIVALSVAFISVSVAALAAYPFSRLRFPGRRQGLLVLLLIQMFPSVMFMIAVYALLQFLGMYFPALGLNSLGGLIFAYSGGIAFNIYLIKGYYDTIPNSLEESAMIDGCTRFQAFTKVVVPLARPILAVVAILTFMGIFNEFVMARVFLQDITKWTYAVGLWQFSGEFQTEWGPFCSAALIGAVPMVLFFLFLQDYIVGGLTQGSVKG